MKAKPSDGTRAGLLSTLARKACAVESLDEYFRLFSTTLNAHMHFDYACIVVSEDGWENAARVRCRYTHSTPLEGMIPDDEAQEEMPALNTYMRLVAASREVKVHGTLKDKPHDDLKHFYSRGLNSCIQVPLVGQGEVTGVLNLLGASEGQFVRADLGLLREAAVPLSHHLHRALLQERLECLRRRLEESESMDWLTRLYNRKHFLHLAEAELARARRHHLRFSLLFLDLDKFRDVNARFGHRGGDEALRHVAAVLKQASRTFDIIGRYGGEEFAILLPGADRQGAMSAAHRLCTLLHLQPAKIGPSQTALLSASIGVATYPNDGKSLDQLMHRADEAMYRAKCAGGNGTATVQQEGPHST
ncbi:MAG: sensor domain-containing diguanylate cyclase [Chloroflexota bacterium]